MSKYEAYVGTDIEDDVWGVSTESAEEAVSVAASRLVDECTPYYQRNYIVTVYRDAEWADDDDGEPQVVGWADRGRAMAVYSLDGSRTAWRISAIVWDGVAVTP